jgi:hypothetical protein
MAAGAPSTCSHRSSSSQQVEVKLDKNFAKSSLDLDDEQGDDDGEIDDVREIDDDGEREADDD